jgi:hypothetical protein
MCIVSVWYLRKLMVIVMSDILGYTFDQVYEYIINSKLWFWDSKEELQWLYNATSNWHWIYRESLNIVELGTYNGISALCLATGLKYIPPKSILTTVDNGLIIDCDKVVKNINSFNDIFSCNIEFIKSDDIQYIKSQADKSINILYIDTDHTLEHMTELLEECLPKMKSRSLLFGHDYSPEEFGVIESVTNFRIKNQSLLKGSGQNYSIWWSVIR